MYIVNAIQSVTDNFEKYEVFYLHGHRLGKLLEDLMIISSCELGIELEKKNSHKLIPISM